MKELCGAEALKVAGGISRETAGQIGEVVGGLGAAYACSGAGIGGAYVCGKAGEALGRKAGEFTHETFTAPTYQGQPPASDYPTDLPTNPGGEPRYNWETASAGEGGSSYAHNDSSPSFSSGISNDSIGGAGAHYNPDRFGTYFLNHDRSGDFL